MPGAPLKGLQDKLGYAFSNEALLSTAVTHRSYGDNHNERLELLGDAVLDLVITRWLFDAFPTAAEGQLSPFRARLVRKQTLASVARTLNLGDYLLMGQGEMRSGGFGRDGTLSDGFEAVIGAIFLDGGLDEAIRVLTPLFADRINQLSLKVSQKDAKTRLQELLQAKGEKLPVYSVVKAVGEAHSQRFTVQCQCQLLVEVTTGQGSSRRIAEQEAATAALILLGADTTGIVDE